MEALIGIIDIPFTKALVSKGFLYGNSEPGWLPCYLFAATSLLNRPLLFTIHTEDGAVFSRVPLSELTWRAPIEWFVNLLCEPWGCLGERVVVVQHAYLKDYEVSTKRVGRGRYLMTFDWLPQGHLEEDPGQHKTMNLLALDNGQFALLPNNECLFPDRHFTGSPHKEWPKYKRNTKYFWANG